MVWGCFTGYPVSKLREKKIWKAPGFILTKPSPLWVQPSAQDMPPFWRGYTSGYVLHRAPFGDSKQRACSWIPTLPKPPGTGGNVKWSEYQAPKSTHCHLWARCHILPCSASSPWLPSCASPTWALIYRLLPEVPLRWGMQSTDLAKVSSSVVLYIDNKTNRKSR